MQKWVEEEVPVPDVNRPYVDEPSLVGRGVRWASRLVGQARRQVLCRLRPAYVAELRERRRGQCRRCGSCCDLTFHCPYLTGEGPCRIYDDRPVTCRDFPIDALDLRLTRVPCGHWFDEG